MTIAITKRHRFDGARYMLIGELSNEADWVQTINIPADGAAVSLTGQTVRVSFTADGASSPTLTLESQVTVNDADTFSVAASASDMSALIAGRYAIDVASSNGTVVTHWAHGSVVVKNSPPSW